MNLSSNVTEDQMKEIIDLVPDTTSIEDEYWRVVPDTAEGTTYSVSSKRDILVKHTSVDNIGRVWKHKLIKMSNDCGVYNTSIKRSKKGLSTYIEHIRYESFPELNTIKTLQDDLDDAIDVPYNGIEWCGRKKTTVHMLPVSVDDMRQVRKFYPEDLPRELWAYVPGTNRKYVVSTQSRGVILKRYRVNGQILKAQVWQLQSGIEKNEKYYSCCLTVGDKQTNTVSHSQILRSFINRPSSDDIYEVNHINGDTHCNILDNLEWVTRQQNSDHYNKSPEMASRREQGYRKISEWGRIHQKEIQTRPEVNAKRSESVKASWTEERKKRQSIISSQMWTEERRSKQRELTRDWWRSQSAEQRQYTTRGLAEANRVKHEQKLEREFRHEDKEN